MRRAISSVRRELSLRCRAKRSWKTHFFLIFAYFLRIPTYREWGQGRFREDRLRGRVHSAVARERAPTGARFGRWLPRDAGRARRAGLDPPSRGRGFAEKPKSRRVAPAQFLASPFSPLALGVPFCAGAGDSAGSTRSSTSCLSQLSRPCTRTMTTYSPAFSGPLPVLK